MNITDKQIEVASLELAGESTGDFIAGAHWALGQAQAVLARQPAASEPPDDVQRDITKAVRAADTVFEKVGGTSRHWALECFLPKLAEHGLEVRRISASEADYEEVLADHRRLVRELDVALNGEDGAAQQASLCDIVRQVKDRNWPKIMSASSSGDKVDRATVELNGVLTDMVAASEAEWPMLERTHLWAIIFAYNDGYSKAYDGREFANPCAETGSQAAAWDLGKRDGTKAHRGEATDTVAGMNVASEAGAVPVGLAAHFPDTSGADAITKARRYLAAIGTDKSSAYYFDDGFPKVANIKIGADATLAVLNALAAPASAPAAEPVLTDEMYKFLTGAGPLEGVWFGDPHPTRKGMFWWRSLLSAVVPAAESAEPDVEDAAEILRNLIDNIEDKGLYSKEFMLMSLSQAFHCLKPANVKPTAATADAQGDERAQCEWLTEKYIDNIILESGYRNAAGGIYETSVYAFAREVAIAAVRAALSRQPSAPASAAPPWVGTASMYAARHKMAVTSEWMRGWNACLDAQGAALAAAKKGE